MKLKHMAKLLLILSTIGLFNSAMAEETVRP